MSAMQSTVAPVSGQHISAGPAYVYGILRLEFCDISCDPVWRPGKATTVPTRTQLSGWDAELLLHVATEHNRRLHAERNKWAVCLCGSGGGLITVSLPACKRPTDPAALPASAEIVAGYDTAIVTATQRNADILATAVSPRVWWVPVVALVR